MSNSPLINYFLDAWRLLLREIDRIIFESFDHSGSLAVGADGVVKTGELLGKPGLIEEAIARRIR